MNDYNDEELIDLYAIVMSIDSIIDRLEIMLRTETDIDRIEEGKDQIISLIQQKEQYGTMIAKRLKELGKSNEKDNKKTSN